MVEAPPGGTHSGAGTGNMLVPLGNDQFFELLAVLDPKSPHPIVRWLSALLVESDRLIALAVEPDDINVNANQLGESIVDVHRVAGDGRSVHFQLTGVVGLLGPELLPFFVPTSFGREWRCGFRSPQHRAAARVFAGWNWVAMSRRYERAYPTHRCRCDSYQIAMV